MSQLTEEWLEETYQNEFRLNGKHINSDDELTKNEVITLLAGYELTGGIMDEAVDRDQWMNKYKQLMKEFNESNNSFDEYIDRVKRRVNPKQN
jgi:hypothetical protein